MSSIILLSSFRLILLFVVRVSSISFGNDYSTLKATVLKTLCKAAGPDQSLGTQYGGFVAMTLFGPKAINAFLLPLALDYWNHWEDTLEVENDPERRLSVQMCQQAILVS